MPGRGAVVDGRAHRYITGVKSPVLMSPAKGKVELQELDVPAPAPGELQVEVHASAISPGTERAFVLNMPNTPGVFPMEPGYCAAGIVKAVGAGVQGFAPGDRVAAYLLGHRRVGNVDAKWAMLVPAGVPMEQAAFLGLGQIALQGVRKMRIELGERVLVLGLGVIGQLALQAARLSGAVPAVGADTVESRMQAALACGADAVLNTATEGWMQKAGSPPVVIESTGSTDVVGLAFQAAAPFGRVALLASTRGESTVNFYRDVHRKGITIVGAHASLTVPAAESRPGFWAWKDDAACFLELVKTGRLVLGPLISTKTPWLQSVELYGRILEGDRELIGSVLLWD